MNSFQLLTLKNNHPAKEMFLYPNREGFPEAVSQNYTRLMVALCPKLVTHLCLQGRKQKIHFFLKKKAPFFHDMQ